MSLLVVRYFDQRILFVLFFFFFFKVININRIIFNYGYRSLEKL